MLSATMSSMSVRSYGAEGHTHVHSLPYLVLPIRGSLDIEVEGRGALLDRTRAACVAAGARHDHCSPRSNAFLVIELQPDDWDTSTIEILAERQYLAVSPAAGHLIDYMAVAMDARPSAERIALWRPLLLDALVDAPLPQRAQPRLARWLSTLDPERSLAWTVYELAAHLHMSVSRIHALFRAELKTTPKAWLAGRRIERVRHWLATTDMSLAEVAYRSGFSDQSALTNAFGEAVGMTPGAYRRRQQEMSSTGQ